MLYCCFFFPPIDDRNSAIKYNETCLTETGRDPGTATFGSAGSEPIGGNLLREVWTGGEGVWSVPVCL